MNSIWDTTPVKLVPRPRIIGAKSAVLSGEDVKNLIETLEGDDVRRRKYWIDMLEGFGDVKREEQS